MKDNEKLVHPRAESVQVIRDESFLLMLLSNNYLCES